MAMQTDAETFRLEYDVTDADLEMFIRYTVEHRPEWAQARKSARLARQVARAVFAVTVITIVVALVGSNGAPGWSTFFPLGVLCAISFWLLKGTSERSFNSRVERSIAQNLDDPASERSLGPHTLEASADGLECIDALGKVVWNWKAVSRIDLMPGFLGVWGTDNRCVFVPHRYLMNLESDRAALLRDWMIEGGGGDHGRLSGYLRTNDADCPSCGHQLRGGDGVKCGACRIALHRWNLPTAFQRRRAASARIG